MVPGQRLHPDGVRLRPWLRLVAALAVLREDQGAGGDAILIEAARPARRTKPPQLRLEVVELFDVNAVLVAPDRRVRREYEESLGRSDNDVPKHPENFAGVPAKRANVQILVPAQGDALPRDDAVPLELVVAVDVPQEWGADRGVGGVGDRLPRSPGQRGLF